MEKIWKELSKENYKECFDILNTNSLIERETYRKFAIALFEVAKKQFGLNDVTLNFVDNMQNNLGVSSSLTNTVTLNLSKMEKQTLFKTVSTIYHELTHIHQDRHDYKKDINYSFKAEFPFIRCIGNERILPTEILGISTNFFYYTCEHEKQARDIGCECAMEVFKALKEISQTTTTKMGTERFIDRCIMQTQTRMEKEKVDYKFASAQIKAFISKNPNFVQTAFNKIKQEFLLDAGKYSKTSKERSQCENRFNYRVGALVLMGCDDYTKAQILSFVTNNFVNRGELFTTFISVIDSPYSNVTKNDFNSLVKLAEFNNCPKDVLANYLVSWDRKHARQLMDDLSLADKTQPEPKPFKGGGIEL